ncbi:TonB-dependent receptor [Sphingomonas sp. A2-49]|uniref:TonB-dependent receptor n=1 Tax=Sphingomonas sp. A2-49 TaxID=1391375 RepID=UPI0021CFDE6C|nr:TonB-dependent receptor [Sphingomonas sp. A2-49]MCU6452458.1 TonB-dependent receptor [Sphingomonas sp. A2-49]
MRSLSFLSFSLLAFAVATAARAQEAPVAADAATPTPTPPATNGNDIVVTGKRLDDARAHIQPSLGATSYDMTSATIQALPGGENQQLNQILLQLPGVVQDGFGQFHVRDDHNGLQYRINGTVLPEGLAVFGQTLSPRLVSRIDLLTGALPAQYGLRSAGIIDITTKSGLFQDGGTVSLYGGSHDTIEPSFTYGGSSGRSNYFVSGDYRHDSLGIESVDGRSDPVHDDTDQYQGFAYVDHILNDSNRISFVGGYSNQWFQIPNPVGLQPDGSWSVGGQTAFPSEALDQRQLERTGFGQLSILHDDEPLTIQASLFARYSSLRYRPDVLGELLFNGQAQAAFKQDFTIGGQADGVYHLGDAHTLRGGMLLTRDRSDSDTSTSVFPVDASGAQAGEPLSIADRDAKTAFTASVYLQDEWTLAPTLTLNYGARFDRYAGYRTENQLSPRANLVWQPDARFTGHIGYARYFVPPPFENVAVTSVASLVGTSAYPAVTTDTTPFAERQHYFDAGFQMKPGAHLTWGIDAYYRISKNLIDEGQFGAPIILTPFNYAQGRIGGIEANASYTRGPWTAYANFAAAKAKGRDIVSSQFSFAADDLATIATRYIYLDHDQSFTGSGGLSYAPRSGVLAGTSLGGTMLYGSGLRTDGAIPNGAKLSPYAEVNLTASHHFAASGVDLRLDVINLADHRYEIRDGNGVGVGAPQYGPRRGVFVGIAKAFG